MPDDSLQMLAGIMPTTLLRNGVDRTVDFVASNLPLYARHPALLKRLLTDSGCALSWGPHLINRPTSYNGPIFDRGMLDISFSH